MSEALAAYQRLESHVEKMRQGKTKIGPGEPVVINTAFSAWQAVRQGDCYLVVVDYKIDETTGHLTVVCPDVVPGESDDYYRVRGLVFKKVETPSEKDKQLVPGNTAGSKHVLGSFEGATLYRHDEWSQSYEGLVGPFMIFTEDNRIDHWKHGDAIVQGLTATAYTMGILALYQRELDAEEARERRNAD